MHMKMPGIIQKILRKAGIQADKSKYHCRSSDSFLTMLRKINSYFSVHTHKKEKFQEELAFINTISGLKPTDAERKMYSIYPYPFTLTYDSRSIEVFRDEIAEMFYVKFDGKRMYYHKGFDTREGVQRHFMAISAEQDPDSPHRYENDFFAIEGDDVVADLGAAEGNFALAVVEKVKKIYLVESDPLWAEALRKTFEPWKEKTHIIPKYAGGSNSATTITLDDIIAMSSASVIKMDIEGSEVEVLKHAYKTLSAERNMKVVITTYHKDTDAKYIKNILTGNGFETQFSKGYMLYVLSDMKPPYFRRGLLFGKKTVS